MDRTTRQHTAMYHGSKASCEQLKKVILEFTNNVARGPETMQIGVLNKGHSDIEGEQVHGNEDIDQEQTITVLHMSRVWTCGEGLPN